MKQEYSVHQRPSLAGCATPEPGVAQPADTCDRMTIPVVSIRTSARDRARPVGSHRAGMPPGSSLAGADVWSRC